MRIIEKEENMDISNLIDEINGIYKFFEDNLSQEIFCNRLLYSFTGDKRNMFKIVQQIPKLKEIIKKLDQLDPAIPKYIYGAGIRGRALSKIWPYNWKGIIDQNENLIGAMIDGVSVIPYQSIENREKAVVVIPNRFSADEIAERLVNSGIKKEHIFNIADLWNELTEKQYFDLPDLPHSEEEVFVDAGAFDGTSTIQFLKWADNKIRRAYIWEPEQENIKICMDNLKAMVSKDKFVFVNKASWSTRGTILFAGDGVLFGIDKRGERVIESSTIVHELQHSDIPTFIKMDIEGAEGQTLCGCGELIKKYCPKLAISVYHKPKDIIELPQLILNFNNSYKFYLRHYSCAEWDTVLYAIPK